MATARYGLRKVNLNKATEPLNGQENDGRQAVGKKSAMDNSKIPVAADRAALGDIKNRESKTLGLIKKQLAVAAGKKEDVASFMPKVEPRRPLRSFAGAAAAAPGPVQNNNGRFLRSKSANITKPATVNAAHKDDKLTKQLVPLPAVKEEEPAAETRKNLVKERETKIKYAAPPKLSVVGVAKVISEKVAAGPNAPRIDAFSSQLIKDIDAEDGNDPLLLSDYVNDIYEYIGRLEKKDTIKERFLDDQPEVTPHMRAVLIDWLIQVHLRFRLLPETMFTTTNLIDQYLQRTRVGKERLQLVGVAALFVASKYEEMYSPEIADFVYITDRTYTKEEIRQMEASILRTLSFSLGRPLPIHFLRRFSKAADADAITHTLAKYFMELSMIEYTLTHFLPSTIAAAALWLSLKLQGLQWTPQLVHYSKQTEQQIYPCVKGICKALLKVYSGKSKLQAVREKYSSSKFFMISRNPCLRLNEIRDIESRVVPEAGPCY